MIGIKAMCFYCVTSKFVGKDFRYASVSSNRQHPPGNPPGNFFEVVKSPAGAKFFCKSTAPGTRKHLPRGVF